MYIFSGKLRKIVKKEGVRVSSEESEDLSRMMDELSPIVDEGFDRESPQYNVLWQERLKYNSLKKKWQMRWHPLIISFTLNLLYSSRAAYHAMISTGFLSLPSECTTLIGVKLVLECTTILSNRHRRYFGKRGYTQMRPNNRLYFLLMK